MYHLNNIDIQEAVSKRIHVTLPDGVYLKLETWAESEARPVANLAAYLLQKVIEDAEEQGKIPHLKSGKST